MSLRGDIYNAITRLAVDYSDRADGIINGPRANAQSVVDWLNGFYWERQRDWRNIAANAPWPLSYVTGWLADNLWAGIGYWVFWAVKQPFEWAVRMCDWQRPWGSSRTWPGIIVFDVVIGARNGLISVYDYAEYLMAHWQDIVNPLLEWIAWQVGNAVGWADQIVAKRGSNLWPWVRGGFGSSADAIGAMLGWLGTDIGNSIAYNVQQLQRWAQSTFDWVGSQLGALGEWIGSIDDYVSGTLTFWIRELQSNMTDASRAIGDLQTELTAITTDPTRWILDHIAEPVLDWLADRIKAAW